MGLGHELPDVDPLLAPGIHSFDYVKGVGVSGGEVKWLEFAVVLYDVLVIVAIRS